MKIKPVDPRYGNLQVLRRTHNNKHNQVTFICLCDCGKHTLVSAGNLRSGNSKSCGCQQRKGAAERRQLLPGMAHYNSFARSARGAGHKVEITYEDFLEFQKISECHYCGVNIPWVTMASNLERKDSSIGYFKHNCVVCCKRCNRGKSDLFTYQEWLQIGDLIRTWEK